MRATHAGLEDDPMPFSPRWLQLYVSALAAAAVAVVATFPLFHTGLVPALTFCALLVITERVTRLKVAVSGMTMSMSVSLVVTILTVLVLPPPAAALVGLPGTLVMPRGPGWTPAKQVTNSSATMLVSAAGSGVCYLTGGHHADRFLSYPEFLWPFAAAVSTCLLLNSLMVAGFMKLSSPNQFTDVLRNALKRVSLPFYSSAVLALTFLSLWREIGWYTAPLVVVPMYIAHWSLSQYAQEEAAHEGTIAALVQAVEIKDSYTRGHSERVARGAEMLAQQLKMPAARLGMLRFAGLLHDIGKLGVPTRLLTSTGGLTEDEFKLLCLHPNHGVAVLRDIRFLTEVYEGVLYHHERLDGRGYPTGKSGDDIPEFARIIGVADAFDAMTSTRSYRAARTVDEAVAELRRGAGSQFDPALVLAFEKALEAAERAGQPWVPTELAPAEPQPDDEAAAAASGPWPLPKRVPGFSFADHDDPFVPVEWFSAWYPSWLTPGAERLGAIPEQRAGEPEVTGPVTGDADFADSAFGGDLDDGWSERMHSAAVREPGEAALEQQTDASASTSTDTDTDAGTGNTGIGSGSGIDGPAADSPDPGISTGPESESDSPSDSDSEVSDSDSDSDVPAGPATQPPARWPVDPGLTGDPRGSMRVRAATPAADRDPRGPHAASAPDAGFGPDSAGPVPIPGAGDDTIPLPRPKAGDPEAWTPSPTPEPWSAPEPPAETAKVADPAEPADADGRSAPAVGPSWFARGSVGPAAARHFFAPGDTDPGPWPPHEPEAKDSEESPA
jgi:hypothetical protein